MERRLRSAASVVAALGALFRLTTGCARPAIRAVSRVEPCPAGYHFLYVDQIKATRVYARDSAAAEARA
jgi:hypothetical protein